MLRLLMLGLLTMGLLTLGLAGCADQTPEREEAQVGSHDGIEWTVEGDGLALRALDDEPVLLLDGQGARFLDEGATITTVTSLHRVRPIGGVEPVPCLDDADCVPDPPCPDRICPPEGLIELQEGPPVPDDQLLSWELGEGVVTLSCTAGDGVCLAATPTGGQVLAAGGQAQLSSSLGLFVTEPLFALDPANVPCVGAADCPPPPPCPSSEACPPTISGAIAEALGW